MKKKQLTNYKPTLPEGLKKSHLKIEPTPKKGSRILFLPTIHIFSCQFTRSVQGGYITTPFSPRQKSRFIGDLGFWRCRVAKPRFQRWSGCHPHGCHGVRVKWVGHFWSSAGWYKMGPKNQWLVYLEDGIPWLVTWIITMVIVVVP